MIDPESPFLVFEFFAALCVSSITIVAFVGVKKKREIEQIMEKLKHEN